jgi:hypothetical protein
MLNLDIKWRDEPRCGLRWLGLERAAFSSSSLGATLSNVKPSAGLPTSTHLQSYRKLPLQAQVQHCSRSSTNPPQSSACDWLNPAPREALQQAPSRATETSAFWRVLLTIPAQAHLNPNLHPAPGSEPLALLSIFIFVDAMAKCARCVKWGPDVS